MCYFICDWICKTALNHTRTKIQFIAEHSTYTLAQPRNTKHMAIDGQVSFHRWLYAKPFKSLKCTTGPVERVNGFNKDVSGITLLPTAVYSLTPNTQSTPFPPPIMCHLWCYSCYEKSCSKSECYKASKNSYKTLAM